MSSTRFDERPGGIAGSLRAEPRFSGRIWPKLEAQGCWCASISPINKDTELHPLVRWQFLGGIPEDDRRAFLFTNVTDSQRAALRHSRGGRRAGRFGENLCDRHGATLWKRSARRGCARSPIPFAPIAVSSPVCQEVVITGDELRSPGGGLASLPVPISTPGFDSAPYLTATLCITKDPETGVRNMGTYRGALKSHGPAGRAHVFAHRRRRRLSALAEISRAARTYAMRHRHRLRARGGLHRAAEIAGRVRTKWAWLERLRARRSARPSA